MPDEFTETTSQSWFGRIGNSIKGILFGIVLLPISVVLLFWNEGRTVTTAMSLKEGAAAVVSVDADSVRSANEKKLIHLSGEVLAGEAVRDPIFGLTAQALRLVRVVEMYQWKENRKSESRKKLGGSEETVTRYTYEKTWSEKRIDSSDFKHPGEHANPAEMPVPAVTVICPKATLGAFQIPAQIIARMEGGELLTPTAESLAQLPPNWKAKAKLNGQSVYLGADEAAPAIGDTRVTFKALKPGTFSILAQQTGDTLAPYPTKAGREIERVESGQKTAELMFQHAKSENVYLTWGLRLGGFALMLFGFTLILNPLSVFADVVPFFGGIVGVGTGLISAVLAFAGSLIVIAIAWLAVRPLLGGALLLTAAGALVFGVVRGRQSRGRAATGSAA